ncbi:SDR family NAD(P)-dependent oxidoreductase [Methylomonas montana]|uniref:SDR family oxidoreductase n=1 Tax=Methylomonas montana TaxID=3058963 RepID=UPI0026599B52|nr:SDR family NAD(P)-dependent oxidoreductase [Methylomonas montana]WKJ89571.1 SDR family NAD(P)-dependent oxidoreductase [Methylomonas montana]
MKIEGNTVLITGGDSGVGLALAKALLQLNNTVIIAGRNDEKLLQVKNKFPRLHAVKCDLCQDSERKNLVSELKNQFPELNIVINNAGVAFFSDLRDENFYENIVKEMETNFLAPLRLAQLFSEHLRNQPYSAIVNIGSAAAFLPLTVMPGYSASKAALHSVSQSLRYQLRNTKMQVIEVLLPPVDTQMVVDFKMKKLSPDKVAAEIIKELKEGRVFIPIGQIKILLWIYRFFPGVMGVLANRMVSNALNK